MTAVAGLVLLFGVLLLAGAGTTAYRYAALRAEHPPQGKMVDVGGYRMRVQCEGPKGPVTLVWLPGSYSQALWLEHLHAAMKGEVRSCMIDRPGLGWADAGPFPRSVDIILSEIRAGLKGAGEHPPYVFAGHSMGGLYAANYAQRYPQDVKALVLLDPTPPDWFVEEAAVYGCDTEEGGAFNLYGSMFGLGAVHAINPLYSPFMNPIKRPIAKDWPLLVDWESRPVSLLSNASAMHYVCTHPFALVRTAGALGDIPVTMVVQTPDADWRKNAPPGLAPSEQANWTRAREAWRTAYVSYTSNGRLITAPAGATHQFPMTRPDFTLGVVRDALRRIEAPQSPR